MHQNVLQVCPLCRRHFGDERSLCPTDGSPLQEIHNKAPDYGTLVNNRYVCLDEIGVGGMSYVFRAYDNKTHENVALKVVKPNVARSSSGIQRFFEEVRSIRRLRHPNIVGVKGFGHTVDGVLYLAMDLLQGDSLESIIHSEGRLAPRMAVRVGRQVAHALQSAHKAGVLHRDLKPENILLLADQTVKLLDFGIAALLDNDGRSTEIVADTVCGTPEYMSPEQIRGLPSGPASDLYSLGVLLFEMLAGKAPFSGEDPVEVVSQHINVPPPCLHSITGGTTDPYSEVRAMVSRLLHKEPDARPKIEEVLAVLNACESEDEITDLENHTNTDPHQRPTLILEPGRNTLPEIFSPSNGTLVQSFSLCRACRALNERDDTICSRCKTELGSILTSQPSQAPLPPESHRAEAIRELETTGTLERLVSLLHVQLTPAQKEPHPGWRQAVQRVIDVWNEDLTPTEGVICHSSEDCLRVVFGLYKELDPAPIAALASEQLRRVLTTEADELCSFQMALSTGSVFVDHLGLAAPDWAIRGSSVDIVTRMVRMAEDSSLLVDDATLAALGQSVPSEEVGSIRPRGESNHQGLHSITLFAESGHMA